MKTKLLLAALMLSMSLSLFAQYSGTCGTNLTWILNNGTLTITGSGSMHNYSSSNPAPWVSSIITSIVISDGVTSIGERAFFQCSSLTSVTIPNSVTSIGYYAFYMCSSLTSITIPNSVTTIGGYAFQWCNSLTSITIPANVTYIGVWAFYNCTRLTAVTISNGVTYIGDRAFFACSCLTSVTIPNSVTIIGREAFSECSSLTSVTIGNSVTSIRNYAFSGCRNLTSITCEAINPPEYEDDQYNSNWVFSGVDRSIPLYVPAQSIDLYKAAYQWRDFTNILPLTAAGGGATGGICLFSVSATQQVTFSRGNLQFNATSGTHRCADGTTKQGTWRFAEHQWDIVGMGYGQTNDYLCHIGGTVANSDNRNISSTYSGWIDLFGWGTSGWKSGANAYLPYSTSTSHSDYYPGGSYENSLTGNYANADWGVYNQIGNDAPGSWRTLTRDEWAYLFNTRANASSKYGAAKVNGVTGVVILPDDWTTPPSGCSFTAGMTSASSEDDWSLVATTNIYSASQWQLMESAGAVFLPAAGDRSGSGVYRVGCDGGYWSSTRGDTKYAWLLFFYSSHLGPQRTVYGRYYGFSVRLVRAGQNEQEPVYSLSVSVEGEGTVTGAGEYTNGTTAILTATPASGYTFSQWSDGNTDNPRTITMTQDMTLTAVFVKNTFLVSFVNYDGSNLQSGLVEYGIVPQYNGTEPTKPADAQYTYTFAGWDKEIATVTANATYTATYSRTVNQYTVIFKNEDGTVLDSRLWNYGATPTCTEPTKPADAQYTYTFAGWTPAVTEVTANATYTATYSSTVNSYTITFMDGNTVLGDPQTVEYGQSATAPEVEIPQCRTLAWDKDFSNITSDLVPTSLGTLTAKDSSLSTAKEQ